MEKTFPFSTSFLPFFFASKIRQTTINDNDTLSLSLMQRKKKKTYVNGHITQLRPTHRMVQVILAKVVFGQIGNIRKLHMRYITWP